MDKPSGNPDRAAALAIATAVRQREAKTRLPTKPVTNPAVNQKADSEVVTGSAPQPTQSEP